MVAQDHLASVCLFVSIWFGFLSIQICYMSVRLFSKKYIQFGFFVAEKRKLTILPKAFYALVLQKGAIFKSVPTLSRIYSLQSK